MLMRAAEPWSRVFHVSYRNTFFLGAGGGLDSVPVATFFLLFVTWDVKVVVAPRTDGLSRQGPKGLGHI